MFEIKKKNVQLNFKNYYNFTRSGCKLSQKNNKLIIYTKSDKYNDHRINSTINKIFF